MSLLTHTEINNLSGIHLKYQIEGAEVSGAIDFAYAIEAAVIKKLAAGVDVEPVAYGAMNKQGDLTSTLKRRDGWRTLPLYTVEAIAAARVKALNEARDIVLNFQAGWVPDGFTECADAIRALIGANK